MITVRVLSKHKDSVFFGIATVLALFVFVVTSFAAGPFVSVETESGAIAGCAEQYSDGGASGAAALRFGSGAGCNQTTSPIGASLPLNYSLSSLTGTVRYVAITGNDTTGNGSITAPYATLGRAITASANNDTIVVREGTYRNHRNVLVSKTLRIIAYPGEIPVFNGAQAVSGGWISEGTYRYIPYVPRAVTNGVMAFSSNQGIAGDGVGKYPDQAWVGTTELKEVTQKTQLVDGKFFVDRSNNRMYLTANDVAKGGIETTPSNLGSAQGRFMRVTAPNVKLEGFQTIRYSSNGDEYGVFVFEPDADYSLVKNVEVTETAYNAFLYNGAGSTRNIGSTIENSTISRSSWMGVGTNGADNFSLLNSKITEMNRWDEFLADPVSGAIKVARSWDVKVVGNIVSDNHGHGVWFDVSNYRAVIANNAITNTTHEGIFWEISDDVLIINNYVAGAGSSQPIRIAGSSGVKLVNNTIVGGKDAIGFYTDSRSIVGCSNPANPPCGEWGGFRDSLHQFLPTMEWLPRMDLMINNIVAYPTATGFCGVLTPMCITQRNSTAYVPLQEMIHQANYNNSGRPRTLFNGNVYANGTGILIATTEPQGRYTTTNAFSTAMAGSPVLISGFETAGKYGNNYVNPDGSPTANLSSVHSQAHPIPTDSVINQYIPAGTRHYGVTYK